jgi:hypothetical protein
MGRPSKMPWDPRLGARVRVILRPPGIPSGPLVIAATDQPRSPSAEALAPLDKRRDTASGGYRWGQRLGWLVWVPPTISLPVGFVFYPPAPELRAWSKPAKVRPKQGGPPTSGPRNQRPMPRSPPTSHAPGACWRRARPTILTSGGTGSRRMPSRARGPLSMRPRPCAVVGQSAPHSAAISIGAPGHAPRTWPPLVPPSPGRPTPAASGEVRRGW